MSESLKKFLDLIANDKDLEAKALACNELDAGNGSALDAWNAMGIPKAEAYR